MRAADAKIKYIGRTIADDNGTIWCALSGSGVEFTYRGASLDVVLAGDDLTKLETQQYEKIKTQQDVDYARIAVYAQFIQQVHSHNPGAYILCVYGIMTDRLYPYVQKAVELYRQKTGDECITALHIEPHTAEAGYGADWHPSKLTHIRAAKEVTAKINSLNKKC